MATNKYLDYDGTDYLIGLIKQRFSQVSQQIQDAIGNIKTVSADGTTLSETSQGVMSVKTGGVGTSQLADGSVTSEKLAQGAIQVDNIDLSSVTPEAIGAAPAQHTHDASAIVSGAIPFEHGGLGTTSIDAARTVLFNFPDNSDLLEYLGLS